MKRILSLLLFIALVFSLNITAFAAGGFQNFTRERTYHDGLFTDVAPSAWYADSIRTAYEMGLMNGDLGKFNPDGNLTLAEAVALASRIHSTYTTGNSQLEQGTPWYQVYVDYAVENGIIRNGEYSDYTATASRSQFATIMCAALPDEALEAINSIDSLPDVDSGAAYAKSVLTLYNAGVLTGNDDYGTFAPDSSIQRSAVATIIMRMVTPGIRQKLTLKAKPTGGASTAAVEQVMIDKEYTYLGVGESVTLHATTVPAVANPNIVWESSDPDFVAVDSIGKVSVMKSGAGKTRITATAESGAVAESFILEKRDEVVTQKSGSGSVYSEHPVVPSFDSVVAGVPLWYYNRIDYSQYDGGWIWDHYNYLTNTLEEAETFTLQYANYLKTQGYVLLREEDQPTIYGMSYYLLAPDKLTEVQVKGERASVGTPYVTPKVGVTIRESGAIPVTGIRVSQTTLSMITGGTATISSTISPERASYNVTSWTSSDSGVVITESQSGSALCTLKAVGVGTATITARSSNGLTAICTVTVTGEAPVYATDAEVPTQAAASSAVLNAEQIYQKCAPAVFYVEVYNAANRPFATGSGFFISQDGTAITNYHVVEGSSKQKIYLPDGRTYWVSSVVATDKRNDIAILKINGSDFPHLEIGDSDLVRGGQPIFTIGSPLGLSNTISDGIISNPSRVLDGINYIQISAPISHGSSGGALLNQAGQVIGITSAGFDAGQNLNLAIPINLIYRVK